MPINTDNIYLFLYALAWGITFYIYKRRKTRIGVGAFILLTYFLYSIASILLYNYYSYYAISGQLSFFPFLYLFLMMFVALQPVLRHDEESPIQHPSSFVINCFALMYIISSLVVLPNIISNINEGLLYIVTTDYGASDLYLENRLKVERTSSFGIFNIVASFHHIFSDFSIFLLFYFLSLEKKGKKLIIYGLLMANIVYVLNPIAAGSRTEGTLKVLTIASAYFLFRQHINFVYRRYIRIVGGFLIGFISFIMVLISISRFGDTDYGTTSSIVRYIGMANINFNKYGLDAGGIRNGDRTCNQFKKLLGFDNVPENLYATRLKYGKMKMDDSVFSTFVGDFTLDFGPVIAAFILIGSSCILVIMTRHNKGKPILFHQLVLVIFSTCVCVQGGMYLFYYSYLRNYTIIGFLLVYLLFLWDYKSNVVKKNQFISVRK